MFCVHPSHRRCLHPISDPTVLELFLEVIHGNIIHSEKHFPLQESFIHFFSQTVVTNWISNCWRGFFTGLQWFVLSPLSLKVLGLNPAQDLWLLQFPPMFQRSRWINGGYQKKDLQGHRYRDENLEAVALRSLEWHFVNPPPDDLRLLRVLMMKVLIMLTEILQERFSPTHVGADLAMILQTFTRRFEEMLLLQFLICRNDRRRRRRLFPGALLQNGILISEGQEVCPVHFYVAAEPLHEAEGRSQHLGQLLPCWGTRRARMFTWGQRNSNWGTSDQTKLKVDENMMASGNQRRTM